MDQELEFIVGSERQLGDLIGASEVTPLLEATLRSGAAAVALKDEEDRALCSVGVQQRQGMGTEQRPVRLEGEPVGMLQLWGESERLPALADLLLEVLQAMITSTLKRQLTTQIHTRVVQQSYEELLESHCRLEASERKYRELAESLDRQVQEKTAELKRLHVQLLQQEKMVAVARLSAGVAHELNTPLGFIRSNLESLGKYARKLETVLSEARQLGKQPSEAGAQAFEAHWKNQKVDFILEDLPDLISQSQDGVLRVEDIVKDLRGASHLDGAEIVDFDLVEELERALRLMAPHLPAGCTIERDLAPLPQVAGNPARISQFFFNLLSNSAWVCGESLQLHLRSWCDSGGSHLTIRDNGPGIDESALPRIFEPFFTTKDVGEGTGMGLAVAYDIARGLGGELRAENPPEGGACFELLLPPRNTDHA